MNNRVWWIADIASLLIVSRDPSGMEGPHPVAYNVMAFSAAGSAQVFAVHSPE